MTGASNLARRVAALEQVGPKPLTMLYVRFGETLEQATARQFGPAGVPPDANLIIVTLGDAD